MKCLWLQFLILPLTVGFVIISRSNLNVNKDFANMTLTHSCDGLQECEVDFTITTFLAIEKLKMYINIRLPQSEDDKFYRKELVRGVFDVDKILKGIRGVPFMGETMDHFLKSADFEARFPLPPGTYKLVKLTITDKFTLVNFRSSFRTTLRFVGKLTGQKQQVFFAELEFRGRMTKD